MGGSPSGVTFAPQCGRASTADRPSYPSSPGNEGAPPGGGGGGDRERCFLSAKRLSFAPAGKRKMRYGYAPLSFLSSYPHKPLRGCGSGRMVAPTISQLDSPGLTRPLPCVGPGQVSKHSDRRKAKGRARHSPTPAARLPILSRPAPAAGSMGSRASPAAYRARRCAHYRHVRRRRIP